MTWPGLNPVWKELLKRKSKIWHHLHIVLINLNDHHVRKSKCNLWTVESLHCLLPPPLSSQPSWCRWWIERGRNGARKASGLEFLGKPISVSSLFLVKFDSFLKLSISCSSSYGFYAYVMTTAWVPSLFLVWILCFDLSLKFSAVLFFWEIGGRGKEILICDFSFKS